jgi:hypothetical protein
MTLLDQVRGMLASPNFDASPTAVVDTIEQLSRTATAAAAHGEGISVPFLSEGEAILVTEQLSETIVRRRESPLPPIESDVIVGSIVKFLCPSLSRPMAVAVFHLAAKQSAKAAQKESALRTMLYHSRLDAKGDCLYHLGAATKLQGQANSSTVSSLAAGASTILRISGDAGSAPSLVSNRAAYDEVGATKVGESLIRSALCLDGETQPPPVPSVASQCVCLLQQAKGCGTNLGNEGRHWDRTRPIPSLLSGPNSHSGSISPTSAAAQTRDRYKHLAWAVAIHTDVLATLAEITRWASTDSDKQAIASAMQEARRHQATIGAWLRDCVCHAFTHSYDFPLSLADHWSWRAEFASKIQAHAADSNAPNAAPGPRVSPTTVSNGCFPWSRSSVQVASPLHALPASSPASTLVDAPGGPATITRTDIKAFEAVFKGSSKASSLAFPYGSKGAPTSSTSISLLSSLPPLLEPPTAGQHLPPAPQLLQALNGVIVPLIRTVTDALPAGGEATNGAVVTSLRMATDKVLSFLRELLSSIFVGALFGLVSGSPASLLAVDGTRSLMLLEGLSRLLKEHSSSHRPLPNPFAPPAGYLTARGLHALASDLLYLRCWMDSGCPVRQEAAGSAEKGDDGFKGKPVGADGATGSVIVPSSAAECLALRAARQKASKHAIASLLAGTEENDGDSSSAVSLSAGDYLFLLHPGAAAASARAVASEDAALAVTRPWKVAQAMLDLLWGQMSGKGPASPGSPKAKSKVSGKLSAASVAPAPIDVKPGDSLFDRYKRAVAAANGVEDNGRASAEASSAGGPRIIAVKPRQEAGEHTLPTAAVATTAATIDEAGVGPIFATPRKPPRPQQGVFSTPTAVDMDVVGTASKPTPAAGLEEEGATLPPPSLPADAFLDWRLDPGEPEDWCRLVKAP